MEIMLTCKKFNLMMLSFSLCGLSFPIMAEVPYSNKAAVAGIGYMHDANQAAGRHDEVPSKKEIKQSSQKTNKELENDANLYKAVKALSPAERKKFFQKYPETKATYEKIAAQREGKNSSPNSNNNNNQYAKGTSQNRVKGFMRPNRHATTEQNQSAEPGPAPRGNNPAANPQGLSNASEEIAALGKNFKKTCDGVKEACQIVGDQLPTHEEISQGLHKFNKYLEGINKRWAEQHKKALQGQQKHGDHALAENPEENNSERTRHPKAKYVFEDIPTADPGGQAPLPVEANNDERNAPGKPNYPQETMPPENGAGFRK